MQQGPGQTKPLGISLGEHSCPPLRIGVQSQPVDGLADGFPFRSRMQAPGNFQVLSDSQLGVSMRYFDQVTDLSPGFPPAQPDALLQDGGTPMGGFDHPQQHPQSGCLSRPVQTQEGIDFPFSNPQGKVLHGYNITVALAKILGLDDPIHTDTRFLRSGDTDDRPFPDNYHYTFG